MAVLDAGCVSSPGALANICASKVLDQADPIGFHHTVAVVNALNDVSTSGVPNNLAALELPQ